ncbi:Ethylene-overproduction protein 1 [Linum perenne]
MGKLRSLKVLDKFKTTQVHHAFTTTPPGTPYRGGKTPRQSSSGGTSNGSSSSSSSSSQAAILLPYGLPTTELMEPIIDPWLKPVDSADSLADLYRRLAADCSSSDSQHKSLLLLMEQFSLSLSMADPKLPRKCLSLARQNAVDVYSKVVLSSWLRFDKREDQLTAISPMDCTGGNVLECPTAALNAGYNSVNHDDLCQCGPSPEESSCSDDAASITTTTTATAEEDDDNHVLFCINGDAVLCGRSRIASLSAPLKAMLCGSFVESRRREIDLSNTGISLQGMRAVEIYSRIKRLPDDDDPEIVLELLSFASRFCCEDMKFACDSHLASLVHGIEDAVILIDYGLEEMSTLLVASCLQVMLRHLPTSLSNRRILRLLCGSRARERLSSVLGKPAAFLLYYFLSQVAIQEMIMASGITIMLLEGMLEFALVKWQKALAFHQLGCVMLERREFKNSQSYFEAAAEAGHVYSLAGVARAKYKQGQQYSAFRLMNSLVFEHKPVGWMYQERSMYGLGREKMMDLNTATELDPTLSFPYKFRAVKKVEEKQITAGISEIDKFIGFRLSADSLELRAWLFIALEDYDRASRDLRALLTLEPNYMMYHGKMCVSYVVELLNCQLQRWSLADCWFQLHDRWSSVDDIGSLAIIHQMLVNDPTNSLLRFRQSLLLLRLNSPKAAMSCLRSARNHATSEHEKLIYEGWILYDIGHRVEALSKADKSLLLKRSFEAFFLKAYILADTNLDPLSSSHVIQLLEEALKCPSDCLRKGQALNNLGSMYADCGKLEKATDCYTNALTIKHTRAHQGLARVYQLRNQRKTAYDEMTKLVEMAHCNASAYEKRSEYCDREMAKKDLNLATQLDPLRTYPYRFRAAVLMDDQKETEAVEELSRAIAFKPELQMLHLRAAFYESMGDTLSALRDCEAALCIDPNHIDTLDLYKRTKDRANRQQHSI